MKKNIIFIILTIFAVVSLFPMIWMFIIALKPGNSVISTPPDLSLHDITLDNFINIFKNNSMLRWIFNSLLVSILTMVTNMFVCSMAGYSFAKKNYPGKKLLFAMTISIMTVSTQVVMVPLFVEIRLLGLYNSYLGLILPFAASPFYVFLACQYMKGIHNDLINASKIDGCTERSIFTSIIIPLSTPVLGIICIFSFITQWNELLWPLIVTGSKDMRTLTVGLATTHQLQKTDYGYLMAGSAISTIPIIIIFLSFQKIFITGLSMGSVKG